ncbi:MAG: hypothetical protein HAW63_02875 [Bdellovibrionaceae bacterium]|nr:hypothetical protein [Pseudobdellovibrionaceae bacterium]
MKSINKNIFLQKAFSNKGMISVDYLFSFLIVMGLTYLILALSFTLSFIEITQYITFSAARSYYASHTSEKMQRQRAELQYNTLKTHPVWSHFFNNKNLAWFKIAPSTEIIISGSQNQQYTTHALGQVQMFTGASTPFVSKLLAFNLPLIGRTQSEGEEESGFKTKVSSFLGREPSTKECQDFQKERSKKLKSLCGNCTVVNLSDNGC